MSIPQDNSSPHSATLRTRLAVLVVLSLGLAGLTASVTWATQSPTIAAVEEAAERATQAALAAERAAEAAEAATALAEAAEQDVQAAQFELEEAREARELAPRKERKAARQAVRAAKEALEAAEIRAAETAATAELAGEEAARAAQEAKLAADEAERITAEAAAADSTVTAEKPDADPSSDSVHRDTVVYDADMMQVTAAMLEAAYGTFVDSALNAESDRGTGFAEIANQIGADRMWSAGYTGSGIDVAIIDTGVAPVAGLLGTDVVIGPDLSFEGGIDELAGLDSYGHGTHMAGLISNVAPDARLVSVKVADNTGAVDVSQVIAAIDWVVQNRQTHGLDIRVLNLSYNTNSIQPYEIDPLSKAVENAWNHGIVVVTAAGNEGVGSFGLANPATNPKVLAVSSTYWTDDDYWLTPAWAPSGDGTRNPDLLAPGVSIESLRVPGSRIDSEHPEARVGNDLFRGSGTSQSAAIVSGAAALILQQRPDLSPDDVKHLLTTTATPTWQFDLIKGNGVIDLATAMETKFEPVVQKTRPATGLGSLEAARGTDHVEIGGELITGEYTVTGAPWDPVAWVAASESATAWAGEDDWSGSTWSGSTWSGSTWSGSTWSGSTWSGSTWSGSTWSGSTWSGSTWSGSTWSGSTWS